LVEEVHELVRPECVRLDNAAPVGVERLWPQRADALAPVVFVGEAAARPANVRHLDRLQRGDDVIADAASIRNRGIRADPYTLISAVAEMLGELAENVAVDLRSGLRRVNREYNLLGGCEGRSESHSDQCETDRQCTHDNSFLFIFKH